MLASVIGTPVGGATGSLAGAIDASIGAMLSADSNHSMISCFVILSKSGELTTGTYHSVIRDHCPANRPG